MPSLPPPTSNLPSTLPEPHTDPEVQNPPAGGAPSGENEEGEDIMTNGGQEAPRVEHNSPPVSTPPPSAATPSFPVSTSPPLERGQRTRQPPAYLKDFVCDRITSGAYKSLAGCRTEKLAAKRGSYEHHENIKFCEGKVVGGITTPGAHSSGLAQQTLCPGFSYADAVKGRRIKSTNIQA